MFMQIRRFSIIIFFSLLSLINQRTLAIDHYEYNSKTQSDYLPFEIKLIAGYDYVSDKTIHIMNNHAEVLRVGSVKTKQALFVISHNPLRGVDESPRFSFKNYPQISCLDDDPTDFLIADWVLYYDSTINQQMILAVGIKDSSVFIQKLDLTSDSIVYPKHEIFHCKTYQIEHLNKAVIIIWQISDYDYDGYIEIFITINSNGLRHKKLYCIEVDNQNIEWVIDNTTNAVLPIENKITPSIFLSTYNSKNGINDYPFNDNYGNLAIINNKGEILSNKILAENHFGIEICVSQDNENYFIIHDIKPSNNEDEIIPNPDSFYISKIDKGSNVIKTVSVTENPVLIYTIPLKNINNKQTVVIFRENIIRFFDDDLNLIADMKRNVNSLKYYGTIQLFDSTDFYYIFTDGLYDKNFQMVAKWHFEIDKRPQVLYVDSLNHQIHLLFETEHSSYIASIEEKGLIDLATVFYHNNQIYILMLLSSFLVGLIITSIYQRKTKSNLNLITSQKSELEQTHQKLKDAQQKLIEAEKFRQAKDIAGGFAHEIRNALFPADGLLTKMLSKRNVSGIDPELLMQYCRDTHRAVGRAIDITKLISSYTRVDANYSLETVELSRVIGATVEANQLRIADQQVSVMYEPRAGTLLKANTQHVQIVLTNLLLNALDAVAGKPNPAISIAVQDDQDSKLIEFTDNGRGIAPEAVGRVFDAFYSTKPDKGTGLGLAMVKKIVEMYGGSISVSSVLGKGTTFTVMWKKAT